MARVVERKPLICLENSPTLGQKNDTKNGQTKMPPKIYLFLNFWFRNIYITSICWPFYEYYFLNSRKSI